MSYVESCFNYNKAICPFGHQKVVWGKNAMRRVKFGELPRRVKWHSYLSNLTIYDSPSSFILCLIP